MQKNKSKLAFSLIELSIVILIIGILVLGITKGSRILNESRLKSARALTTSSPVSLNADNLALWLETTSEKSFDPADAINGNGVANWRDIRPLISGGAFDLSQNTANSKPLYIRSSINSLPALSFDGVDDYMQRLSVRGDAFSNTGTQITIFVVQKYYSPATYSSVFWWDVSGGSRLNLHAVWIDGHIYFDFWDNGNTTTNGRIDYDGSALLPKFLNKTHIITAFRRQNGSGAVRLDGVAYGSSGVGTLTSNFNISQITDFSIERASNGAGWQYPHCDLGEIIIFKTALKDSEISDIEKYLSLKWGIALKGL